MCKHAFIPEVTSDSVQELLSLCSVCGDMGMCTACAHMPFLTLTDMVFEIALK